MAIETPRGPVVDRISPAGAKDARRDARVLVSALRTDSHCLRRLEPRRERVRLANRMRQQLWRYYPQFLDAVDDDIAVPWALDLWRKLPPPRTGQRVREATLSRALKQHRIRRVTASTLRARMRAPAVRLAPVAAEAALAPVRLVTERLTLGKGQLDHARHELDRLVHHRKYRAVAEARALLDWRLARVWQQARAELANHTRKPDQAWVRMFAADGDAPGRGRRARGQGCPRASFAVALATVRLILRQQETVPPPVCPPVTEMRPELARIAVPAPTLSAYDALVEGAR